MIVITPELEAEMIYYPGISTWAALSLELIAEYNSQPFISVNCYGSIFPISSMEDLEKVIQENILPIGDF